MRTLKLSTGLLAASTFFAGTAKADILFNNFGSVTGLTLVGDAAKIGDRLRVAPAFANQAGAAWFDTRQNVTDPFTTEFRFDLSTAGADGLVFVIQREGLGAIGGTGEQLGYHGIQNSIAIELDTYQNLPTGDPDANHISVHTGGPGFNTVNEAASIGVVSLIPELSNGNEHTFRIEYVPGSFKVFVDDLTIPALQIPLDIGSTLNLSDGTAWVGFTAATGGVWQAHDVLSWTFTENATVPSGNTPPDAPVITEPVADNLVLNPFDVHMETMNMMDADVGDLHVCSDFEIWTINPIEKIWITSCIGGPAKVHSHLGDGTFIGSHAALSELKAQEAYMLRVRHRDDSGDSWTEWGPWSERPFMTGAANTFYPLLTEDVVDAPAPAWKFAAGGADVVLPVGNPQPVVHFESVNAQTLLSFAGFDGQSNTVTNPPPLPLHVAVRVRIEAGDTGSNLVLAESDVTFVDEDCRDVRILLPDIDLPPFQTAYFWVSSDGATWVGAAGDTEPQFNTLARGLSLPWVPQEPGYQVEIVAGGFQLPVNIAFIPNAGPNPDDPYFYVTELYGKIKVVRRDGTVSDYATGLLNYNPTGNFPGSGEQGLSGIAVDPITGDVFASMLYAAGNPHYPKVERFTSLDGGLTAATQTTILSMPGESQGQSHFISHLEMLADNTLLVHMGDGFNSGTALNMSSYRGKILRMNLDGSAVTTNPFYNASNGINAEDYIYVYGVRNPFGGAFRASDGFHYEIENGPSVDRFAKVVPGTSYGWSGSDSHMFINALYNWQPATGPVNLAWVQPETFGGSQFPQSKWDHGFVSESGPTYASGPQSRGKRITEWVLDAQGNLVSGPDDFVVYTGTGRATAVGLAAGPDGLYFTELYDDDGNFPTSVGAQVLRVRFTGGGPPNCGEIGSAYCTPAVVNSSGMAAEIHATGSVHVADNDLTLEANNLPTNQFGYFLVSMTQAFVPNAGGSDGNLCLGGLIGRYATQVQSSGANGEFSIPVDLTAIPPIPTAVAPGDTWNFQGWFRDDNPGPTSNFTDGVLITFQ